MNAQRDHPCLSIVIVNSGGEQDTLNCLASIRAYPPEESYEIIMVDNCSNPPLAPQVQDNYPQLKLICAPRRQGFARNYNLGMRQASGDFIMILNNDTLVHPSTFANLLQAFRSHPQYGIAGPKIISEDGHIQATCNRALITPWFYILQQFVYDPALPWGRLWQIYRGWQIDRQPSGGVECISGACMLVSRQALKQAGALDESYDFYYEDVEWCHRMQNCGLIIVYVAESQITHLGDRSLSKVKVWAKQSEYLGAMHYFQQYYYLTRRGQQVLWLVTLASYGLRALAYTLLELLRPQESHAQAYRELWRWMLGQSQVKKEEG
jgi:GT2 family glycosyltransferase